MRAPTVGPSVTTLIAVAKVQSDHLRINTEGKVWKAHFCARLADVVQKLKRQLTSRAGLRATTVTFLMKCCTPKPMSRGIAFVGKYIDENWEPKNPSRESNCYCRVGYKFEVTEADVTKEGWTLDRYRKSLATILRSWYWQNDEFFRVKLSSYVLAFRHVGNGRWIV